MRCRGSSSGWVPSLRVRCPTCWRCPASATLVQATPRSRRPCACRSTWAPSCCWRPSVGPSGLRASTPPLSCRASATRARRRRPTRCASPAVPGGCGWPPASARRWPFTTGKSTRSCTSSPSARWPGASRARCMPGGAPLQVPACFMRSWTIWNTCRSSCASWFPCSSSPGSRCSPCGSTPPPPSPRATTAPAIRRRRPTTTGPTGLACCSRPITASQHSRRW